MALQQVFMVNMKKYRKEAEFTQEKLAELCDTDPHYIGQIENGRRFPSVAYIERIAGALKVAPYRLFYDDTAPEAGAFPALGKEQKQRLKTMLADSVSRICAVIDEDY
ncbi:MAG: helix-turn-helix domain-containing protein [Treponema sp.]|jgi:transcriptional regulator with XRE-family HTH domain|nr:helix-turn-helix domain-containing protein [Treponema sp.]